MGRREDRELLESTWMVLEPKVPGTPFTKKDIADAEERARAESHQVVDTGFVRFDGPLPALPFEPSAMLPRRILAQALRSKK